MVATRFKITKPTTTQSDGDPTDSCYEDMQRVFRLIEDERHLIAHSLYHDVLDRIAGTPASSPTSDAANGGHHHRHRLRLRKSKSSKLKAEHAKDVHATQELIESKQAMLDDLDRRCRLFARARQNLMDNDHWTLAQTLFGITTYYRNEPDGSLSIKMEGRLEGVSLFDQVAVLREVDLHYKWAPFCSSSLTVAHLNKLDTVGWFVVGLPSFGLMRDACFRAIGCDSMLEDGSILLVAQGIADRPEDGIKSTSFSKQSAGEASTQQTELEKIMASEFEYLSKDPVLQELDLPEAPTRIGSGRMTIRAFQSLIHVESPTSARTSIIANIDPNLPLIPKSLLDFIMKKLCGVLLNKLQHAASRVSKDPIQNPHASKMRQEEDFYKNWLMAKFEAVCKLRNWEMPPVTSFQLSDQQMDLAQIADEKKNRSKTQKTLKFYHSMDDEKLDEYFTSDDDNASEPANLHIGQRAPPRLRTMSTGNDSTISDISTTSASVWQNNPISTYLREVEEKTQMAKAREIERSRERAANRLKPKQLDEDAKNRLEELRLARERRAAGIKAEGPMHIPVDTTKSQRKLIKSQHRKGWATMWTSHGTATKIVVVAFLVMALFSLLYMDSILEHYISNHGRSFWGQRIQDTAVVTYMFAAAAVHFILCYVALMYAFSALQIGTIAGTEAKKFYSQNLHLVLAVSSSSMVGLSLVQASVVVFLRWFIWEGYLGLEFVKHMAGSAWSQLVERLPQNAGPIGTALGVLSGSIQTGINAMYTVIASTISGLHSLLVQSNAAGRILWMILSAIVRPFLAVYTIMASFSSNAIASYQGDVHVPTWREDAFGSTRYLLSHSGVFLLVLLLLFNLSAKKARNSVGLGAKNESFQKEDEISVSGSSAHSKDRQHQSSSMDLPLLQESSSGSPQSSPHERIVPIAANSRTRPRSLSTQFDTIDEASDENNHHESITTPNGTSSDTRPKRRGSRWFGRRRPRNQQSQSAARSL